jgi:hypothetical protein
MLLDWMSFVIQNTIRQRGLAEGMQRFKYVQYGVVVVGGGARMIGTCRLCWHAPAPAAGRAHVPSSQLEGAGEQVLLSVRGV